MTGAGGKTETVVKSDNLQATHNTPTEGGSTVSPYLRFRFNRPGEER